MPQSQSQELSAFLAHREALVQEYRLLRLEMLRTLSRLEKSEAKSADLTAKLRNTLRNWDRTAQMLLQGEREYYELWRRFCAQMLSGLPLDYREDGREFIVSADRLVRMMEEVQEEVRACKEVEVEIPSAPLLSEAITRIQEFRNRALAGWPASPDQLRQGYPSPEHAPDVPEVFYIRLWAILHSLWAPFCRAPRAPAQGRARGASEPLSPHGVGEQSPPAGEPEGDPSSLRWRMYFAANWPRYLSAAPVILAAGALAGSLAAMTWGDASPLPFGVAFAAGASLMTLLLGLAYAAAP